MVAARTKFSWSIARRRAAALMVVSTAQSQGKVDVPSTAGGDREVGAALSGARQPRLLGDGAGDQPADQTTSVIARACPDLHGAEFACGPASPTQQKLARPRNVVAGGRSFSLP